LHSAPLPPSSSTWTNGSGANSSAPLFSLACRPEGPTRAPLPEDPHSLRLRAQAPPSCCQPVHLRLCGYVLTARWCPPWERQAPAWHGPYWLTKGNCRAWRPRQRAGHAWRPATGGRCRAGAQRSQGGHRRPWPCVATRHGRWRPAHAMSGFPIPLDAEQGAAVGKAPRRRVVAKPERPGDLGGTRFLDGNLLGPPAAARGGHWRIRQCGPMISREKAGSWARTRLHQAACRLP